jgi:preprotein translocase subunit SecG
MFGGGVTSSLQSSGVAERNLNRITIILGLVWIVSIIALGLITRFYPARELEFLQHQIHGGHHE